MTNLPANKQATTLVEVLSYTCTKHTISSLNMKAALVHKLVSMFLSFNVKYRVINTDVIKIYEACSRQETF